MGWPGAVLDRPMVARCSSQLARMSASARPCRRAHRARARVRGRSAPAWRRACEDVFDERQRDLAFAGVNACRRPPPSGPGRRAGTRRAPGRECWDSARGRVRITSVLLRHAGRREDQAARGRRLRPVERLGSGRIAVDGIDALLAQRAHGVHVELDHRRLDAVLPQQPHHVRPVGP